MGTLAQVDLKYEVVQIVAEDKDEKQCADCDDRAQPPRKRGILPPVNVPSQPQSCPRQRHLAYIIAIPQIAAQRVIGNLPFHQAHTHPKQQDECGKQRRAPHAPLHSAAHHRCEPDHDENHIQQRNELVLPIVHGAEQALPKHDAAVYAVAVHTYVVKARAVRHPVCVRISRGTRVEGFVTAPIGQAEPGGEQQGFHIPFEMEGSLR